MGQHFVKAGHRLAKAIAGRNRYSSNALQAVLVAAEQFPLHLLQEAEQKEELENLPETVVGEDPFGTEESSGRKKRRRIGENGWENGFKLIRGVYWIRIQRRGVRECINLKTNSIRLARERREELGKLMVDASKFGSRTELTVSQLWERYAKVALVRIKPSTFAFYERFWINHILPFIGDMRWDEITNEVVEQLLAEYLGLYLSVDRPDTQVDGKRASGRKTPKRVVEEEIGDSEEDWEETRGIRPERGNGLLQSLKVVFFWGIETKLLDAIPFTNSKVPRQEVVRPYVSLREVPKFIDASMKHSEDPEARELQVCMGIFLGLRPNEIRLARRSAIDTDKQTFAPDWTKTKSTRQIYIPSFLATKLNAYIASRNISPNGYLFTCPGGLKPIGKGFLRHVIQKAGQAIGKPALTPHRMRNTFATLHAIAGTPLRVIQRMLGHKCIQTTLLYVQDVPELVQIAQARLESLVGFSDVAGPGTQQIRPWSEEIGHLMGNLAPMATSEPVLAASPLMELLSAMRIQVQQLETALASLQEVPKV